MIDLIKKDKEHLSKTKEHKEKGKDKSNKRKTKKEHNFKIILDIGS